MHSHKNVKHWDRFISQ